MSKDKPWEKLTPRQRLARTIRGMRVPASGWRPPAIAVHS
jgi:hypothetical protein